tara:strand:+ start:152 stop:478 length:327 start_codon:yes stop_codon:yes gene_type:complete
MIMTLTENDFIELTNKYSQYKDNFSHVGKKALFEYLQEYEQDTGEQIEFDYISLCCEYSEYETEQDLLQEYSSKSLESLREETEIIEFTKYNLSAFPETYKSYIIRDF